MIKSDKKYKSLATLLNSKDSALIFEGLELLRDDQPFEGAIGLLTLFFDKTDDVSIRKTITSFMNDLKDQSASAEIISEIKKPWKSNTTRMLVSSCWQSGLDYSDYLLDFAGVFLEGDYVTAIECLTVIEESVAHITSERKAEIIEFIKESTLSLTDDKKGLTYELMAILGKE